MNEDMKKRLAAISEEEPDADDLQMIADAQTINDGSTVPLDMFMESLDGYSGKILIRIPRSLHKKLAAQARIEGVSLNQYALYKLSR